MTPERSGILVGMDPRDEPVLVAPETPDSPAARRVLRLYIDDVASSYYGRPATVAEIDSALRDDPSDDLVPPKGHLLVAQQGGAVVGCAGLRLLPDGVGEVCRVFVVPAARRRGLASRLLHELETLARESDRSVLRLDTRHDLVDARRLYAAHGYAEVPAFNQGQYAEHWFAKQLDPQTTPSPR